VPAPQHLPAEGLGLSPCNKSTDEFAIPAPSAEHACCDLPEPIKLQMRNRMSRALLVCWLIGPAAAESQTSNPEDGSVQIPAFTLPPSAYMSEESKRRLAQMLKATQQQVAADRNSTCPKRALLDEYHQSFINRARAAYAVDIEKRTIAGVETDVVRPKGGVPARNRHRVLINLHGGSYSCATRGGLAGQVEAIPIAAVAQIKVIALDYRTSPEHKFPAATEDVAIVYRELLKTYRPRDIGIYGCSTGATLTATAIAWLQKERLPLPGAVGLFCSGATRDDLVEGDSYYTGLAMMGRKVPAPVEPYPATPYMQDTRTDDPLAVPVSSLEVLSRFPPTLLISGTRDLALSSVVYTDTRLAKAGVQTELHVWEGMWHAFHFDVDLPESREAYEVVARFFDRHLGRNR
jgi:epsilon-lactone hydrolase